MTSKHCPVLRDWYTTNTNQDGEPRKMAVYPMGCRTCKSFGKCADLVKSTHRRQEVMKNLEEALCQLSN